MQEKENAVPKVLRWRREKAQLCRKRSVRVMNLPAGMKMKA